MTPFLFLISFVVGLVVAYSFVVRRSAGKYHAVAEYWVFLPGEALPTQESVMTRLVGPNPYSVRGQNPIGPAEGLVFSDVRLHIALILKRKNPHAFRPDLFGDDLEPTQSDLTALSDANSFAKLRFISDIPLKDRRHLQFLIHAADAYAELGNGILIYDATGSRLLTRPALQTALKTHFDATVPQLHTRVIWKQDGDLASAETRGLQKVGLPELVAPKILSDQKVLMGSILESTIDKLWTETALPASVEVTAFDDQFKLVFESTKDHRTTTRVLRMQAS